MSLLIQNLKSLKTQAATIFSQKKKNAKYKHYPKVKSQSYPETIVHVVNKILNSQKAILSLVV